MLGLKLDRNAADSIVSFFNNTNIGAEWRLKFGITRIVEYLLSEITYDKDKYLSEDGSILLDELVGVNIGELLTLSYDHGLLVQTADGELNKTGDHVIGNSSFTELMNYHLNPDNDLAQTDLKFISGAKAREICLRHNNALHQLRELAGSKIDSSYNQAGIGKIVSYIEIQSFLKKYILSVAKSLAPERNSRDARIKYRMRASVWDSYPLLQDIVSEFRSNSNVRKHILSRYHTSILMLSAGTSLINHEEPDVLSAYNFFRSKGVYQNALSLFVIYRLCQDIHLYKSDRNVAHEIDSQRLGKLAHDFIDKFRAKEHTINLTSVIHAMVAVDRRMIISGTADDYNIQMKIDKWDDRESASEKDVTATWAGFGYYRFLLKSSHYLRWAAINSNNSVVTEYKKTHRLHSGRVIPPEHSIAVYIELIKHCFNETKDLPI